MSTYRNVVSFVEANPGRTSKEINEAFGCQNSSVFAALSTAKQRGALRGEPALGMNNRATYKWYVQDLAAKPVKRKKLTSTVNSPLVVQPSEASTISLDSVVDAVAKTLADAIAARVTTLIAQALRPTIVNNITEALSTPALHAPEPEVVARKYLAGVLVIGLLPAQAGAIQQEFHEAFDMRFWKNEDVDKLYALTKSADHIYIMTQFVSHTHVDAARRYGKNKIEFVNGGLSSLRDTLTSLYTQLSGEQ